MNHGVFSQWILDKCRLVVGRGSRNAIGRGIRAEFGVYAVFWRPPIPRARSRLGVVAQAGFGCSGLQGQVRDLGTVGVPAGNSCHDLGPIPHLSLKATVQTP